MKKPFTFLAHACLLVCLLTVLLSCKTQEQMSEAATQLPISSPVSTRPEVDSGSRTAEPAKTLPWPTGTGIPVTSSDPTSTATPVPPTLTSEEKANNLTNLMRAETDCKLPCWWSIIPERSHVAEVKEALEAQGFVWGEDNTARIRVGDIVISLQFEIEEGIIRTIYVGSDNMSAFSSSSPLQFSEFWEEYDLASLLDTYGQPSQVFVYHPFQFDPSGGPVFHLVIAYTEEGVALEYLGSAEHLGDNRYRACASLDSIGSIGLLLYQAGTREDVIKQLIPPDSVSHIAEPAAVYEQISWQQATGTDFSTFYKSIRADNEDICFEFSSK